MTAHIATFTEAGITAICPTTGRAFMPQRVCIQAHAGWCWCTECDAQLGTGAAYNAAEPQIHAFERGDLYAHPAIDQAGV